MPKVRKRKNPITQTASAIPSTNAQECRKTIRRFHVLLKRRSQLKVVQDPTAAQVQELADIEEEMAHFGGLEKYQQMSANGQKGERGGGSEKIFIAWMKELGHHHEHGGNNRLRCATLIFHLRLLLCDIMQAPRSRCTQTRQLHVVFDLDSLHANGSACTTPQYHGKRLFHTENGGAQREVECH